MIVVTASHLRQPLDRRKVLQFSKDYFLVNHRVGNRLRVGLRLELRVGKTAHFFQSIYCVPLPLLRDNGKQANRERSLLREANGTLFRLTLSTI